MKPVRPAEFRQAARERLPRMFFDYIDGSAYDGVTAGRNLAAFEAVRLRQAVLRDTRRLTTSTHVLGQTLTMPVVLSPVGLAGLYARRGEVQAAQAADAAGLPFCLSTVGVCSVEEVTRSAQAPWFQLYMLKDRGYMRELLARAWDCGSRVLVFTVDLPTAGARYLDYRSGLLDPMGPRLLARRAAQALFRPSWFWNVYLGGRPHTLGNVSAAMASKGSMGDFLAWVGANMDRSVTWGDLEQVREAWPGRIVIKGILDPADAARAVAAGADGIVVSNHGGRQLDGVRASLEALPRIASLVDGRCEVFMDGGVRSGRDILKALALGAKACFIGRLWAFALAAEGRAGVARLLAMLRAELETAMILTGCVDVRDAATDILDLGD